MRINITALFVCFDDFCKLYDKALKERSLIFSKGQRIRQGLLSLSELMFIEVLYHFSPFKDFKRFYRFGLCIEHRSFFKELASLPTPYGFKEKTVYAHESASPLFVRGKNDSLFCIFNDAQSLSK